MRVYDVIYEWSQGRIGRPAILDLSYRIEKFVAEQAEVSRKLECIATCRRNCELEIEALDKEAEALQSPRGPEPRQQEPEWPGGWPLGGPGIDNPQDPRE